MVLKKNWSWIHLSVFHDLGICGRGTFSLTISFLSLLPGEVGVGRSEKGGGSLAREGKGLRVCAQGVMI